MTDPNSERIVEAADKLANKLALEGDLLNAKNAADLIAIGIAHGADLIARWGRDQLAQMVAEGKQTPQRGLTITTVTLYNDAVEAGDWLNKEDK